jgi:hypothetical protein
VSAEHALFFIDANKYLDLYRTASGKALLAAIKQQAKYIFVTEQVVREVRRNKIRVAEKWLTEQFKELQLKTFQVPDHLVGANPTQNDAIRMRMKEVSDKTKSIKEEISKMAHDILEQISRSQDDVTKALAPVFAKATPHSPEELQRARERRELGNPPGDPTQAIGDQLNWEQILTHFKDKKRLWIVSRDSVTAHSTMGKVTSISSC